ncbi:MAG: NAD(P)-binding protein [Archangium sp.]|nr:NAD(P)-binding protein [Archangium sp.]
MNANDTQKFDLIVVGGGLGGLLTAARAAKAGRRVVVLEQAQELGGFGRSPELGGRPVNLGPHAIYLDGPAEKALLELGVELKGFIPGAAGFFESNGELLPLPTTALGLLTAPWLTWRERVELAWSMREVLGAPKAGVRVSDWLAGLRSERVRAFFASLIRVSTYCNANDVLTTKLAFAQLKSVLSPSARGVLYLDGGWQSVVNQLEVIAKQLGVRIRTGAKANSLSLGERVGGEGAHPRITLSDGTTLGGDEIALALPLAAAAKLTGDAALKTRAENAKPVRAACLDLVLKKLPKPERRLVLGLEQPTYFSVHSAPETKENIRVHVAWYLAPDDATDAQMERTLEAFVDRIQPGWRDELVGRRYFPHLRVMEDVPREATTTLAAPLHLISTVATTRFLFDAIAQSGSSLSLGERVGVREQVLP